jgi:hypothetical protein
VFGLFADRGRAGWVGRWIGRIGGLGLGGGGDSGDVVVTTAEVLGQVVLAREAVARGAWAGRVRAEVRGFETELVAVDFALVAGLAAMVGETVGVGAVGEGAFVRPGVGVVVFSAGASAVDPGRMAELTAIRTFV